MVTRPPDTQVATEEDVLIYEGMAHRTPYRERIFLEDQPFQDPEAHQVLIERIRDSLHGVFNVTDIDSYRMCPYRFYIERILGLGAESPPKFQVEHRIWGSLAHRTMEIMLKTGDFTVDEIEERLFKALSQALGEYSLSTFWERVAVRIFRRLLPSLKIQEESLRKEGFIPYMFETRLSHSINGWLIRGKIDRIDVHRDSGGVCLMDYKTGEADKKGLQMPLYALLWQNNHSNREIKKAGFYSLKNGMVSWVFDHKDRDECINNALEEVKQYIDQIIKGEFLPAPKNDSACRRCDHKPVCEKEA
jgi:ATP-dependent helicase/DNAse subunit B